MKAQLSLLAIGAFFLHSSWTSQVMSHDSAPGLSVKTAGTSVNPNFSFFRTHRQGRGVTATWGLTSNTGVTGFVVQRTYEDPADPYAVWDVIYLMPCSAARSFKHQDMNVFPGFISYRVIAYLQIGGSMMSAISTEHIVRH